MIKGSIWSEFTGSGWKELALKVADLLIKILTKKNVTIYKTDKELYDNWNETKLSLFQDCPLIWEGKHGMKRKRLRMTMRI